MWSCRRPIKHKVGTPNDCLDKAVYEIRWKRKARAQYLFIYYFFRLGFLIMTLNHQNPGLLDRQENEA